MEDVKKPRLFIRNPSGDETWQLCGDIPAKGVPATEWASLARLIGAVVANEIDADFGGADPGNQFTIEVKREMMTDAEVAALPEE